MWWAVGNQNSFRGEVRRVGPGPMDSRNRSGNACGNQAPWEPVSVLPLVLRADSDQPGPAEKRSPQQRAPAPDDSVVC
jgi:hypothetical protein